MAPRSPGWAIHPSPLRFWAFVFGSASAGWATSFHPVAPVACPSGFQGDQRREHMGPSPHRVQHVEHLLRSRYDCELSPCLRWDLSEPLQCPQHGIHVSASDNFCAHSTSYILAVICFITALILTTFELVVGKIQICFSVHHFPQNALSNFPFVSLINVSVRSFSFPVTF